MKDEAVKLVDRSESVKKSGLARGLRRVMQSLREVLKPTRRFSDSTAARNGRRNANAARMKCIRRWRRRNELAATSRRKNWSR